MDLRTHYPYSLLRYGLIRSYPSLSNNKSTEVAVMGAGITGALVAYHLQKCGIRCIVVDRRHVALGSTAASTSLIQYEIDQPLVQLMKMIGCNKAVRAYERCRQAVHELKTLCEELGHPENYESRPSLQYASYLKHLPRLQKEYEARKRNGFRVDLLTAEEVRKDYGFSAPAALYTYEAAEIDAYLLTHQLLEKLDPACCDVFDHTAIEKVSNQKNGVVLTTSDGYTIKAKKLVIACGYESGKYLPRQIESFRTTYALVSEPVQAEPLWKDECLIWETADPYLYMRTTAGNRVVIGGKDTEYMNIGRQLEILPRKAEALIKSFGRLFPGKKIKIDFQWAGAFARTKDGLPYIGSIPGLPHYYFALGYGGNGISFSLVAAQMISSMISGQHCPDLDLFSFQRGLMA